MKIIKSIPLEVILRSRPPALVGYKNGEVGVAHVAITADDDKKYAVHNEHGVVTAGSVLWVDSDAEARKLLKDLYPLSKNAIYSEFRDAVVTYKSRLTGYVGGSKTSKAKAAAARANGSGGGGRPPGSLGARRQTA